MNAYEPLLSPYTPDAEFAFEMIPPGFPNGLESFAPVDALRE